MGPFLAAALICDRVLQESDGALSAIRIIDQIVVGSEPDADTTVSVWLLVCLKGGELATNHQIRVAVRSPGGAIEEIDQRPLELGSLLPDGIPGANLVLQLTIGVQRPGDYWFDVEVDRRWLTAVPLRLVRASSASSAAATPLPR